MSEHHHLGREQPACPVIVLAGPTAVGKSAVAIELARRLDGEVVSADAMQVYQDIRIVTAKPLAREGGVPHHAVDCVPLEAEWDVAAYRQLAGGAVDAIIARGKVAVVAGGSGLYIEVLLDGLFPEAPAAPDMRYRLQDEARQKGSVTLHDRLATVDPAAAQAIGPTDTRRLIRALEVYHTTGKPISAWQKERSGGLQDRYPVVCFVLNRDREALYQRINARVERMLAAGLEAEIRSLAGRTLSRTAAAVIGIPEMQALIRGSVDLATARAQLQQNTRRLAKRQLTWFRKDPRWQWLMIPAGETPERTAERLLARIAAGDTPASAEQTTQE